VPLVLRARCTATSGTLLVEAAGREEEALPTLSLRVTPWLPPSEAVVRYVAQRIDATLELTPARARVLLALAAQ
jgi:hypothetical protein